MKQINIYFEDKEFESLKKLKDSKNLSWKELILQLLPKEEMENNRD